MGSPPKEGYGCAAFAFFLAALILVPGIIMTMREEPTIFDSWREARGGELLTTGGRAAAGDTIKPAGEELELLIVGSLFALFGIVTLVHTVLDRRASKRQQRGEE